MNADLLFVVNAPEFFLSHRLALAIAARSAGFRVHVATGPGPAAREIRALGFPHHALPLSRSGRKPWAELRSLWAIFWLMRRVRPRLVHLVTIKPVLYGGLAARLAGVPGVIAAVSGLGTVFVGQDRVAPHVRRAVEVLYRLALGHRNIRVIFQNPDDRDRLIGLGAIGSHQAILVPGSGVSLADFPSRDEPTGVPVVTFAGRLLKDKGVQEFVEASRLLQARGVAARFWLVGAPDPGNPSSVSEAEVARWHCAGWVEALGYRPDIPDLLAQSNIVTLPSCYGEGLPKVLVEAAAAGRAVVTTDHPGCRDAVEVDRSALLVPVRDPVALADAIELLIKDPSRRRRMGEAGRALAERRFSLDRVVDIHMGLYGAMVGIRQPSSQTQG